MPVFITERHLLASDKRMTHSDNDQKGFALRTTPNGVFTFYYQHLNEKTGKRDWHLIGSHPEWTPVGARNEATRLAGLVAGGKSIKMMRQMALAQARAKARPSRSSTTTAHGLDLLASDLPQPLSDGGRLHPDLRRTRISTSLRYIEKTIRYRITLAADAQSISSDNSGKRRAAYARVSVADIGRRGRSSLPSAIGREFHRLISQLQTS